MLILIEKVAIPIALKLLEIYLKRERKVDPLLQERMTKVFNHLDQAKTTDDIRAANRELHELRKK